jgi:hypothetical protein
MKKALRKLWAMIALWWTGPKSLKRFIAEDFDMSNVRLTWKLPVPSNRQRPIAHVQIEARVSEDLPWTEIAIVDAPATELLVEDVAPGDWFYRGTVVDTDGNVSEPAFASATLDYDAPTGLAEFAAAVE